jgi:protoporphyrinogen/coproporphyrinogen III oxidase
VTTARRVVIVGGGIAGLACAHRVHRLRPDVEVEVLEADERTGGKIHTAPFAGRMVDEAADAFLARVPAAVDLARELGLEPQFVTPAVRRAFLYRHRTLHPFPEGQVLGVPLDLDLLRASGVVSAAGVERAALDLTMPGGLPGEPAPGSDESVGSLVRRRLGDEVFEALVGPLLSGVNAGDADQLSLQAGAPQLAAAVRDQPSLIAGLRAQRAAAAAAGSDPDAPIFYGLHDGSQGLTDALVDALPPGSVRTGVTVHVVAPADGGGFNLVTSRDRDHVPHHTDVVVLATPASAAATALHALQPDIALELAALEWSSVVMVTLAVPRAAIEHPLDGSGFLVAGNEDLRMTACSFSSTKWAHLGPAAAADPAGPDGSVLLRVSAGRHPDASALDLDDDALVDVLRTELVDAIGLDPTVRFDPTTARVTRWRSALPQYRPGHLDRQRRWRDGLAAAWPGLWLTGASYEGLGIPACIADAHRVAEGVADSFG